MATDGFTRRSLCTAQSVWHWFHGQLSPVAFCLCLIAAAIAQTSSVEAAIYKCVDAAGNTTYTGYACEQDESTRRISKAATAVPGFDCRIAEKLAIDTARRMQAGETSATLYDSHGGMNSLSPLAIGLISYIYGFDGNTTASFSRIATLATERCRVGSFGNNPRSCDAYPRDFIESLGGCESAQGKIDQEVSVISGETPTSRPPTMNLDGYALPELGEANPAVPVTYAKPSTPSNGRQIRHADDAGAAVGISQARASCLSRLNESLEETVRQMRASQSVATQERLRDRQRQLKKQLSRC
ncbi:MAG: DUF4124 domain-containing protein [Granulosicoccus sp.]|nr:DUF4124 domain-containing protein [Granulosicoccus sp.]